MTRSTFGWFDYFLKGEQNGILAEDAKGSLLHDGKQQVANGGHMAARRSQSR